MAKHLSIGQYLLNQLHRRGVKHIFCVPGDYVLGFCGQIEQSRIKYVGTTREESAGFAADAYARIRGLGAACVTYCVGGFGLTNPTAGAYAEKSPVVVISGAPGTTEYRPNLLLHHTISGPATQREVFEKLTITACSLNDPLTAFREIDRVLAACLRFKRPVYIELPRDCVDHQPDVLRPTG